MKPSSARISTFRKTIYTHYEAHGRHDLPWRASSCTPWQILVSEIMLQQTQVDRVIPKFSAFIARFPDPASLAGAATADLLAAWQGLGYNRRALFLQRAAAEIVDRFGGVVPHDPLHLASLPGIGPHTAAAIAVYAFDTPQSYIETNIRAVFIHHFFADAAAVSDADIAPLFAVSFDRAHPRRWCSALMDYGTSLKKTAGNPARRSAHHVTQSRFEGSDRQVRGALIKVLLAAKGLSPPGLAEATGFDGERITPIIEGLAREGFVKKVRGKWMLS